VPVLAAGGIMTGRQMAAAMAMGAAAPDRLGVACDRRVRNHRNLRAKDNRGVPARRGPLQGPHRQACAAVAVSVDRRLGPRTGRPGALSMPLQSIISRDAFNSIDRAAAAGNAQARDLVSYFVGQGVGLIDSVKSAGAVVQEFKEDFVEAVEHMNALMEE
jgi:NAD(P)H-dependent flavin oxidoreductase YrpB (nitropropane dioxygenase family)